MQNGNFETALAIAKSLDFNQSKSPHSLILRNWTPLNDNSELLLSRSITDGPLSFSVPDNATVDYTNPIRNWSNDHRVHDHSRKLIRPDFPTHQYRFDTNLWMNTPPTTANPMNFPNPVPRFRRKVHHRFRVQCIALTRNTTTAGVGETREYIIVVDLTTDAWKQRYLLTNMPTRMLGWGYS